MQVVALTEQEWNQVLSVLGDGPWRVVNPLLMKIGGQLREQKEILGRVPGQVAVAPQGDGASKEAGHE